MVSLKFSLTEEEYYRYNYYTAWAAPEKKSYRARYFLRVILIYGGVALFYIIATRSRYLWIDITVFVVTGLIYLFFIPFFVKRSVRRRVKEILSKKENQHVIGEAEILLSDTEITDRDTVSETRYTWDAIVHFAETSDSYYLYTNSYHAIVIPKRAVQEEAIINEMQRLFNEHLPLQA